MDDRLTPEEEQEQQTQDLPVSKGKSRRMKIFGILGGVGFVVFAGFALISGLTSSNTAPSRMTSAPNTQSAATGQGAPPAYQELVEKRNQEAAAAALKDNKSAVVTPGGSGAASLEDLNCTSQMKILEDRLRMQELERERMRAEIERMRAAAATASAKQQPSSGYDDYIDPKSKLHFQTPERFQEERGRVAARAQKLLDYWESPSGMANKYVITQASATSAPGGASITTKGNDDMSSSMKAGMKLYARLGTGINSDLAGAPVMAEILTGEYKGTRVIGNFKRSDEYLVLEFTTGTTQDGRSMKFRGVAIDVGTAMAGVADEVNNHYFTRYVALLGAAFLQGYGEIMRESMQQVQYVQTAQGESTPVQTTQGDTNKVMKGSLATVGAELANQLRKNIDRPPTVTMNSGSEIGILVVEPAVISTTN